MRKSYLFGSFLILLGVAQSAYAASIPLTAPITFKRGTEAQIGAATLKVGEPAVATDKDKPKLFVRFSSATVAIGPPEAIIPGYPNATTPLGANDRLPVVQGGTVRLVKPVDLGIVGQRGLNGINGSTWFSGAGIPIVGIGVDGDYYFRSGTSEVFRKASSAWSVIAVTKGLNGNLWLSGVGVPLNSIGTDNDLYLRTDNGGVYRKISGAWNVITNIKGAAGPQGPAGPDGKSFVVDATGLLSLKGAYDAQLAGFSYLATDTGNLYIRQTATVGVWSSPISFGKGETGATGPQGLQGIQGLQGVKGNTGSAGAKGDTGATGTAGVAGSQGLRGIQGSKGDKGDTGAKGDTGLAGSVGPKGDTGGQGVTGPQGAQGTAGGSTAWRTIWNAGTTYNRNDAVSHLGSSYTCLVDGTIITAPNPPATNTIWNLLAAKGNDGAVGATGSQGAKGDAGNTGATGATGSQGIQGIQGAIGPQGIKGDTGSAGQNGGSLTLKGPWSSVTPYLVATLDTVTYNGSSFTATANSTNVTPPTPPATNLSWVLSAQKGADGSQGPQGIQGLQGPVGSQGAQGIQGNTGPAGAYGSQLANAILAGPSSGATATPLFRALVAADIPATVYRPATFTHVSSALGRLAFVTMSTAGGTAVPRPAVATDYSYGIPPHSYLKTNVCPTVLPTGVDICQQIDRTSGTYHPQLAFDRYSSQQAAKRTAALSHFKDYSSAREATRQADKAAAAGVTTSLQTQITAQSAGALAGATALQPAAIGVSVQGYNANTVKAITDSISTDSSTTAASATAVHTAAQTAAAAQGMASAAQATANAALIPSGNLTGQVAGTAATTVRDGALAGATALPNARKGATYTILPYGDTRLADYYCSATDCGSSFQTVFDAIKASGKGGSIQALEGTYPFATSVNAVDADSVVIKGVGPVGMWASGGAVFQRTSNIVMFNYSSSAGHSTKACVVDGIHFKDSASGYSAPVLSYRNAHNMFQINNYFEGVDTSHPIPQAIYANRAWDFWTINNNFRDCGTGNTGATACVTSYNGSYDNTSGWKLIGNRWESRPGTSFYSDSSGAGGQNNTISFIDNKFEGSTGKGYPAIAGVIFGPRIAENYFYYSDPSYPVISLETSDGNIIGNHIQGHKNNAINIQGNANIVTGNNITLPQASISENIKINWGSGNSVFGNTRNAADTIVMVTDSGTGNHVYRNSGAEKDTTADLSDWPPAVSTTELGYLDGVTSAIQTQINAKAATSSLATVATTGSYPDLASKPTLGTAAAKGTTGSGANAATATGTPSDGCAQWLSGNVTSTGSACGVGSGGSGAVGSGTSGQFAYYSGSGTSVAGRSLIAADIPTLSYDASGAAAARAAWPTTAGVPYWTSGTSWTGAYAVGTGASNLVQLDSSNKLPAVDGSALTLLGVGGTDSNTALGKLAASNPSGGSNTSIGRSAGNALNTGAENTFLGNRTGTKTTTGSYNTAFGSFALYSNLTGSFNMAIGKSSLNLVDNSSGVGSNVAIGGYTGATLTTGTNNTFIGDSADTTLATVSDSTAIGSGAKVTADHQVVLGGPTVTQTLLNGNIGIGTTSPTNQLDIVKDGAAPTQAFHGYNAPGTFSAWRSDGSLATPASTGNNKGMFLISGGGYHTQGTAGWGNSNAASGLIGMYSEEAFTDTAQGTSIRFATTPKGAVGRVVAGAFTPSGGFYVGPWTNTTPDPGAGNLSLPGDAIESTQGDATTTLTLTTAYGKITGTGTVNITGTIPAWGVLSKTVEVCGSGSAPTITWSAGSGSVSWGTAGAPTFPSSGCMLVTLVARNPTASATTTAAWKAIAGGTF